MSQSKRKSKTKSNQPGPDNSAQRPSILSGWVQRWLRSSGTGDGRGVGFFRSQRMAFTKIDNASASRPVGDPSGFSQRGRYTAAVTGGAVAPLSVEPAIIDRFAQAISTRFQTFAPRDEVKPLKIHSAPPADLVMANNISLDEGSKTTSSPVGEAPTLSFQQMLEKVQRAAVGSVSSYPVEAVETPQSQPKPATTEAGEPKMMSFQQMLEKVQRAAAASPSPPTEATAESPRSLPKPVSAPQPPESRLTRGQRIVRRPLSAQVQEVAPNQTSEGNEISSRPGVITPSRADVIQPVDQPEGQYLPPAGSFVEQAREVSSSSVKSSRDDEVQPTRETPPNLPLIRATEMGVTSEPVQPTLSRPLVDSEKPVRFRSSQTEKPVQPPQPSQTEVFSGETKPTIRPEEIGDKPKAAPSAAVPLEVEETRSFAQPPNYPAAEFPLAGDLGARIEATAGETPAMEIRLNPKLSSTSSQAAADSASQRAPVKRDEDEDEAAPKPSSTSSQAAVETAAGPVSQQEPVRRSESEAAAPKPSLTLPEAAVEATTGPVSRPEPVGRSENEGMERPVEPKADQPVVGQSPLVPDNVPVEDNEAMWPLVAKQPPQTPKPQKTVDQGVPSFDSASPHKRFASVGDEEDKPVVFSRPKAIPLDRSTLDSSQSGEQATQPVEPKEVVPDEQEAVTVDQPDTLPYLPLNLVKPAMFANVTKEAPAVPMSKVDKWRPTITVRQLTGQLAVQGWRFKSIASSDVAASPVVIQRAADLEQQSDSGQPLAAEPRGVMEQALGRDFGQVRIHTAPLASLGVQAATKGRDVYVEAGQSSFDTPAAMGVLGHELTHVAQQGFAMPIAQTATLPQVQRSVAQDEEEAEGSEGVVQRFLQFSSTSMPLAPVSRPTPEVVQRESLEGSEPAGVSESAEDVTTAEELPEKKSPDLKRLAQKIYPLIKRRLAVERQRRG